MPRYSERSYSPQSALNNIGATFWAEYKNALFAYAEDRSKTSIPETIHSEWDALGHSSSGTDIRIEWALALYDHGDWPENGSSPGQNQGTAESRSLLEELDAINTVPVPPLGNGYSETVADFYNDVIEPLLPDAHIVCAWQSLLYEYAEDANAIFFFRKYHSAPKNDWNAIRRGFITEYTHGGYVCCDNFFAHYIYAMALDGFVPALTELRYAIYSRNFPYGYMSTKEERELQAYVKGKAPRINSSGWKLAHLLPVNGTYRSMLDPSFVDDHFPRGSRNEWTRKPAGYHSRHVPREMSSEERRFLASHFIRLASPINYFLVPKQANERDAVGNNIGEHRRLLEYVMLRFEERYGSVLVEFLKKADMPFELLSRRDTSSELVKINFRSDKNDLGKPVQGQGPEIPIASREPKPSPPSKPPVARSNRSAVTKDQLHEMARLYLEQGVSFRNLERRVLGIDSQARGGGFVAKYALNDFGITAADKGMLSRMSPEEALASSTGQLRYALIEVYGL